MINLNFRISNPWSDTWTILWSKSNLISQYKAWEFNGYRTNCIADAEFSLTFTGDHAGVRIMIGLLGYEVELQFYDTRHWDYENRCWHSYT